MAADHGVHRFAQPVGVERAGDGDVQLHRIQLVARLAVLAWKSRPCCSGVSGRISAIRSRRLQLVDLLLAEPGRGDIRRRQPAAAVADMRADPGQGVKPQLAQPADLLIVERRGRPGPGRRADAGRSSVSRVPALSSTVCPNGIGIAEATAATDTPSSPIRHRSSESSAAPRPVAQVVEPDRRVGPGQIHVGVEVAQQPVGQAVGQGAQLFFGVLDHRAQRGLAGEHLCPGTARRRVNATGYLVVNHPTVRDKSTSAASSS